MRGKAMSGNRWWHRGGDLVRQSARAAVRFVREAPGFALIAILLLALGIGANSAMFSALDAVVLRPLPFPHSEQLLALSQVDRQGRDANRFVAPVRLEDWNRLATAFTGITGTYADDVNETSGALPERLNEAMVAPRFLRVLGVAPLLGRDFVAAEQHFGGPQAALISYRLWQRRFNGDAAVVGRTLHLGRSNATVVGVMPADFSFPSRDTDIWQPSPADAPFAQSRQSSWYRVIGRMRPGVTPAAAQADLLAVQGQLGRAFPKPDAELTVASSPLKGTVVGETGRSLWLLYGAVTLLLLITCANLAALLAARTAGREHEIGVRYSLGASRKILLVQLLAEVLLLALVGAGLGLLVAAGAVHALQQLGSTLPRASEICLNGQVTVYTLVCAVATTLVCGLAPALRGTRRELAESLAMGGRTQASARRPGQWMLVGVQVALATVLLTGAGLLLRSLRALGEVPLGYDPDHVLSFRVSGSWGETVDYPGLGRRIERTLDGLRTLPGVTAASTAGALPGSGWTYGSEFVLDGHPGAGHALTGTSRAVSSGYFATLGLPTLLGSDCRAGASTPEALVNRSFAALYLPGTPAIGHTLATAAQWFGPPALIRGVVADAHEDGAALPVAPAVYFCTSAPSATPVYLLRTAADPASVAEAVRRRIHVLEPTRSVYDLAPLPEKLGEVGLEDRLRTGLLSGFAVLAVTLAAVGLYGTLSYGGQLRRRETGLRLTLGATRPQIARALLSEGLRVAVIGCGVGAAVSLALHHVLAGMLFGVKANDGPTYAGVVLLVALLATGAALPPAIRAARTEPAEALRDA